MTACTASFAHGSNDLANAIGPFSTIFFVWKNGVATKSSTPTDVWMLVFGSALLVIGLGTYGYNIMKVLGNRLTAMSPSRGFSMELGASITVLLASQCKLFFSVKFPVADDPFRRYPSLIHHVHRRCHNGCSAQYR